MRSLIPPGGGLLGLIKPPAMTSHDLVALVRRRLGERRVGHCGTLDPAAAGVLPVLIGPATRLAAYLSSLPKVYRAQVLFGLATTTADLAGEPLTRLAEPPAVDRPGLAAAVAALPGRRLQRPPAYSARRVDGKRLYRLARRRAVSEGELDRAARPIEIHDATLLATGNLGWGEWRDWPVARLAVGCSPGTYIREIAEGLGAAVGLPACLAFLVRQSCAGLTTGDCASVEALAGAWSGRVDQRFPRAWRAPAAALRHLPAVGLDHQRALDVRHGRRIRLGPGAEYLPALDGAAPDPDGPLRLLDPAGRLLGIGVPVPAASPDEGGGGALEIRPRRVFPHSGEGGR